MLLLIESNAILQVMYRHVLLDFDGVLCDSLAAAIEVHEVLRGRFPALPPIAGADDVPRVYAGAMSTALAAWLSDDDARAYFVAHADSMAARSDALDLFDGVPELLASLPHGTASIVTSAHARAVCLILERAGVDMRTLRHVLGRSGGRTKADRIQVVAADLALAASDLLYVTDTESDILECREIPVDVVAVTYGYHPAWHLSHCGATYIAGSPRALRLLLRRLLAP
jgi:phosphoglycolate phosphatase-like HAD superfamily hydrolase